MKLTTHEFGSTDLNYVWPLLDGEQESATAAALDAWANMLDEDESSSSETTCVEVFVTQRNPVDLAVSKLAALYSYEVMWAYKTFEPRIQSNRRVVLVACSRHAACFNIAPDVLKTDKHFVLQVVSRNAYCLKHVGERMRSDKEVVAKAVANCAHAFIHAAPVLASDKEFVKSLCARDFRVLKYATIFHDDHDVVGAAVANNGTALQWASHELRCKDALIIAALRTSNDVADVLSVLPGLKLKDDAFWASVLTINGAAANVVERIIGVERLRNIQAKMIEQHQADNGAL